MSIKSLTFYFSLLLSFYALKGLVFVLVYAEPLILIIAGFVFIKNLLKLITKNVPDKKKKVNSIIFILALPIFLLFGRHLTTVTGIMTFKSVALSTLIKHQNEIPIADRINGGWILDDEEFKSRISPEDYNILKSNYNRLNPIRIDQEVCYIEIAGGLKGGGGYFYKINPNDANPRVLGFFRINNVTRIMDQWYYYE